MVKRRWALRAMSVSGGCSVALPLVAVYRIVRLQKSAAWENAMARFCPVSMRIAAASTMLALGIAAASAQTAYPNRPIKIIVPIGPGGSFDLVGRLVADALSKRM